MEKTGIDEATPQFSTAEYQTTTGAEQCGFCHQPIAQNYYRVNGTLACPSCADRAQREVPKNNPAAYMRALLFGVGGAILGLILYAAVGIITGWMIGFVSLAVGYIIGKAMMKGSGNLGGRRYQITAILLTYTAVSVAAVPIAVSQYVKQEKAKKQAQIVVTQPANENSAQPKPGTESSSQANPAPTKSSKPAMGLGAALGYLLVLGLASPFLELAADLGHGLIGLVILFVGIQIAWRITAGQPGVQVAGPFDRSSSAPA